MTHWLNESLTEWLTCTEWMTHWLTTSEWLNNSNWLSLTDVNLWNTYYFRTRIEAAILICEIEESLERTCLSITSLENYCHSPQAFLDRTNPLLMAWITDRKNKIIRSLENKLAMWHMWKWRSQIWNSQLPYSYSVYKATLRYNLK